MNTSNTLTVLNLIPVLPSNLFRTKGPKTPKAPELNEFQKEILFGSMLGDLTAERTSANGNTRLRFYMSYKNKKLIYHYYYLFKPYVKTEPKIIIRSINKLTKISNIDINFSTLKYSMFNWVYQDFYNKINNKNIKIVPKNSYEKMFL